MCALSINLKQSDQFMDAYDTFYDRYLRGVDPVGLAQEIYKEYLSEFDADDLTIMPDVCYALSLALWECGAAVLEVCDRECWRALIAVARRCRKDGQMMTMEEILQSPIRCLCWFDKKDVPMRGYRELLGNLLLDTDFNGRAGAMWSEDGGFSSSNEGGIGYMELNFLYLEREMRAFRKEHRLEDCTVGDFFIPGAPVLPEKWI